MEKYFLYTEINQKNGPEGMKGRDTAKKIYFGTQTSTREDHFLIDRSLSR